MSTNACCAACGNSHDNLKQCSACKSVRYCDGTCQRGDWRTHKKICPTLKEIKEILLSVSTKESWLLRDDCPICMAPMPHDGRNTSYNACCGQMTCMACQVQQTAEHMKNPNASQSSNAIQHCLSMPCCFCRQPRSNSNKVQLEHLYKQIRKGDPNAMSTLAGRYLDGLGVPKDERVAFLLLEKATEVGLPSSAKMLGQFYEFGTGGVTKDLEKAKELYTKGAEGGNSLARTKLGEVEVKQENYRVAVEHFKIAAAAGDDQALEHMKEGHRLGVVSQAELLESTAAHKAAKEVVESDARKLIDPQTRRAMSDPRVLQRIRDGMDCLDLINSS